MLVYLIFSLLTSAFMNWYNKKAALVERWDLWKTILFAQFRRPRCSGFINRLNF